MRKETKKDVIIDLSKEHIKKVTFNKKRPLSWSAMSSFEYDKEQWWFKYCLHGDCRRDNEETGEKAFCVVAGCADHNCPVVKTTVEMEFGKKFAKSIEDGTCSVPELMAKLKGKKEFPFKNIMFGDIELVGFADDFCPETFRKLDEVKTGKKKWDQKRVDGHGQIDMYLLMNFIQNKIRPEEVVCDLHWIPTQDNNDFSISFVVPIKVHSFRTKRTTQDVLNFGARIKRVFREMEEYANMKAIC